VQHVRGFVLNNFGGFVCAGKIAYLDDAGDEQLTDDYGKIPNPQSETMDAASKGVPDGSVMRLYIWIEAGDDRTGAPYFICDYSSPNHAHYNITGTTLDSTVTFEGLKPFAQ
jgi:hypothetical protein